MFISISSIKYKIKQKIDAQFSTTTTKRTKGGLPVTQAGLHCFHSSIKVSCWYGAYIISFFVEIHFCFLLFSSLSYLKKAYSFNSGAPDSFSSLLQSHDTADNEKILTARLIYQTIACENTHFSSLFAAGDVSRNVPSGEAPGEMDVFEG